MNEEITNGKRAALAREAVIIYAGLSSTAGPAEEDFFFDFEREAEPGADDDRLAALLGGLMHYAERRTLSFDAALRSARRDYQRQRTALLPGDAVRRTDPARPGAPLDRPLIGEVTKARPGSPPSYLVDFITAREWVAEPHLTPSPRFMIVPTGSGNISSAHVARLCLTRVVAQIEADHGAARWPDQVAVRDFRRLLAALSNWSGIGRRELLASFSQVLTEENGWLIAGAGSPHPVRLAAVNVAAASAPGLVPSPAPAAKLRGVTRCFRKGGRHGG